MRVPGASRLVRGIAALRLSRPLDVPVRRDRPLLLRRPRRDGHVPHVLLRSEPRDDDVPRRLRAARGRADVGRVRLDGRHRRSTSRAGLLIRQTHHWAALVFVAAIVLHLMRVFFTGAFRKPRELNWFIGLTLLTLALLEGFTGYSLPDDLLSGMGLAIAYSVALSIPIVGAQPRALALGRRLPRLRRNRARLFIVHVLLLPVLIAVLICGAPASSCARSTRSSRARDAPRRTWSGPAVAGVRAPLARPAARGRRRARRPRRAGADQPGLAVRPLRDLARDERRPARLVSRLADRRAASDALVRRRDRRPHRDPESVLRRGAVPVRHLRTAVRVAGARAAEHGGRRGASPARPTARRTGSHRGRGGRLRLRLHHLRGRGRRTGSSSRSVSPTSVRSGSSASPRSSCPPPCSSSRGRSRASCETPAGIRSAAPTIAPSVAPAAAASSDRLTIAAVSRSSENRHLGTTG